MRSPLERQLGALAYRQITLRARAGTRDARRVRTKPDGTNCTRHSSDSTPRGLRLLTRCSTVTDVGPDIASDLDRRATASKTPIEPGFLSVLDPSSASIEPSPASPRSTGRRLALARWLCRADNPLSIRVIVNRVWQYHFGRGLVGTASDFGRLGEPPTHPAVARLAGNGVCGPRLAVKAAAPA